MDTDCLNLAVRNLATEDAENFKNTECLGWRHYVKSDWTVSWLRKSWGGGGGYTVFFFFTYAYTHQPKFKF